jgi:hypothetical protein
MFCGLSSASHISSSWNFMCRWFRILYTDFTLQTFLCSNFLCPNCYNLSLLRNCSSETLELWPRYFFELITGFFIEIRYGFVCAQIATELHYGIAPMELWARFFLSGLRLFFITNIINWNCTSLVLGSLFFLNGQKCLFH